MLRRILMGLLVGASVQMFAPSVRAGFTTTSDSGAARPGVGGDYVEAQQYDVPEARVAGSESTRQTVTAWAVTRGTWNGENLKGLSLVLIKNVAENLDGAAETNCYVSHLATAAQRDALVSAYLAAHAMKASDSQEWRQEPAVIRVEVDGKTVIVHVGLIS